MSRRRRVILWIIGSLICLTSFLVSLLLLLPYLVNLEPIREKIEVLLFQHTGGKVGYEKIDLFYFPRLGIEARSVTLSIEEKVACKAESVKIYLEVSELVKGKLGISRIEIESPDVTLRFPLRTEVKQRTEGTALKELEEIVARVATVVPRLKVVMKEGRLNLLKGSQTVFSFSDVDANMTGSPREPKIEITCRSNFWEMMSAEVTIRPVGLSGHGRIKISSFRPHLLSGFLSPGSPLKVTDSELNLNLSFETKGLEVFQAVFEGSVSKLTFQEGGQETAVRGKRFQGAFQMEQGKIDISLDELNLEYPRLILSGKFRIDSKKPVLRVEAQGREVDVTSTREVTLKLGKNIPVMHTIFDIVREGRIPLIMFQSQGRTMSELDDTERFSIKGNILDGKISVPIGEPGEGRKDFILDKAAGEVVISDGILEGRNLRCQWKNQQLQEGKLRVGLEGDDAPFHLEIGVETDLSLLPPLINRLNKDPVFRDEMVRLRQLEGRAAGKIVLGESLKSIGVKVDAQKVNLVARYDRIPYPVTINGGAISFEGERLSVRNLSGRIGASSFSELTGGVVLGKEPYVGISSGSSVISLDEIFPWVYPEKSEQGSIYNIQSVKGQVILSGMRLSGPLMRPGEWDFETASALKNLVVSTTLLPEPFSVSSGKINLTPQKIMMADIQLEFLSASLNVSGALYEYQKDLERAELSLSGRVTPQDVQWLSNTLGVEPRVRLRSPIGISQLELSWRKGVDVSLKGDLTVEKGPEISLDVLRHSKGIKIKSLVLRDGVSDASIKLDVEGRAIDLAFSGRLSEKTISTIFTQFQSEEGWVRGDFQAHIDMDRPVALVAHGKAELNHFSLPPELGRFPMIDEVSVNARGDRVTIERSNFIWGGKRLALSGDVSFSEKRIILDLDLFTENVDVKNDLSTVTEIFSKGKMSEKDEGLQLQGTLRIKTKSLLYDRFAWMPFDAEIMLDPHEAEIDIKKADLCGISTPGNLKIANQNLSLDLQLSSKSEDFQTTFSCLLDQETKVKGEFDLRGKIIAQGRVEELVSSMKGDIELESKRGYIYYSITLMRILEFVNSTEIFRGKLPDLRKEGLEYNFLKIRASFHHGKLMIEEAVIDGTTLELVAKGEIDLTDQGLNIMVLVAPLKTIDRIVKLIPLVREILAGTLITIPLRVHGSLKDPKVTPLSPSAIGSELLGMMKRALGLPFKVIGPFMPRKKENSNEEH